MTIQNCPETAGPLGGGRRAPGLRATSRRPTGSAPPSSGIENVEEIFTDLLFDERAVGP